MMRHTRYRHRHRSKHGCWWSAASYRGVPRARCLDAAQLTAGKNRRVSDPDDVATTDGELQPSHDTYDWTTTTLWQHTQPALSISEQWSVQGLHMHLLFVWYICCFFSVL